MARVKTESKRNEILEAASRVFSERDFHDVLIDDVAAAARVGKGTIYRYFDTKEDLYFGAVLHGLDALAGDLDRSLARETSPRRRLERIAREILTYFWTRGLFTTLARQDDRRFARRQEEVARRREVINRLVSETLLEGIERREFRGIDVAVGAELFRGMIRAAAGLRRKDIAVEELVQSVVEIFTRGIAKETA